MPSETTKFTVAVVVDNTTNPDTKEDMDFEVTTTMGELNSTETKADWQDRHLATVKEARQKALDADFTPDA